MLMNCLICAVRDLYYVKKIASGFIVVTNRNRCVGYLYLAKHWKRRRKLQQITFEETCLFYIPLEGSIACIGTLT